MNGHDEERDARAERTPPPVHWTTYEASGYVHAVAAVPRHVPKSTLGFGATDTTATLFLDGYGGPRWAVSLPVPVDPLPVSISYNNGVVEAVFARTDDESIAEDREPATDRA